jgi:hypothetical protein
VSSCTSSVVFHRAALAFALSSALAGSVAVRAQQGAAPQMAAPEAAGEAALAEARQLFDSAEYERAVGLLDQAIVQLLAVSRIQPKANDLLLSAYEIRGRAQFSLNKPADARANFEALLRQSPTYTLSDQVSPRVLKVYEDVRRAVTGQIVIVPSVNDAEIKIDGEPLIAWSEPVTLAEGAHTVTASRPGFAPLTAPFTVKPGPTQNLPLTLERVSALLSITTLPAGVEVLLNGVVRGTTEPGVAGDPAAGAEKRLPGSSKPLVLSDLPVGTHSLEFRRDCYIPAQRRVTIEQLADFRQPVMVLKPAVATVDVAVKGPASTVFLDDAPRGTAPMVLDQVCEGTHTIDVRSPYGRYARRVTVKTGDRLSLEGVVKPAFGLVSVTGQAENIRGGVDPRVTVEQAFADDGTVTLFAPPADKVEQASGLQQLPPGWLAFDQSGRPVGRMAGTIAPPARIDISTQLARSLEVQGLAGVALTSPAGDEMLLSLLAAGSAEPDVLSVKLNDGESMSAARRALSTTFPLFRQSIGILAIDVLDVPGATIASVEEGGAAGMAGLQPGEVVVGANAQPVRSVIDLERALAALIDSRQLTLYVRAAAGGLRKEELTAALVPRALVMSDQTLLANKAILDLRQRLTAGLNSAEEPIIRLNLAIALMHVKNWAAARTELERVSLPAGPGISNGTVQYLLGLCYEALGLPADAMRVWKVAAADTTGLLTEDGPPIAEMAATRIAALERSRR